jgi:hydrogenase expression/formation protein HypE
MSDEVILSCPTPLETNETIQLAHGGGGRLMQRLLSMIQSVLLAPSTNKKHDGAIFEASSRLAFTTDSYVITPRFFPGGDIGALAVYGTVNDLAMCGAMPLYFSVGLIIEEGLSMQELSSILRSMRSAADEVGASIVTGDTKVVERGKGDGIFINTAGIGQVLSGANVAPSNVMPGDRIIVSGDVGRHGVAILSVREGLQFETSIESDCAALHSLVGALVSSGEVHCLRDLTRGGLAAALHEIARDAQVSIEIKEDAVPVSEEVKSACELLGLDPFFSANEGRMIAFVPEEQASIALLALQSHPLGRGAAIIGEVSRGSGVVLQNRFGGRRLLDLPLGEQLPRIC